MTISSTTRKAGPFIGNGTTTAFPFAYKVFQASDLLVVRLDTTLNIEHELTLNTDYTVTLNLDQDSNPGGTVNLLAALATGYTLTLTSDLANLQPTDLTNQGGFYPDVINDALDRATIQIQQLQEQTDRAIKLPVSSTSESTLPNPNPNDLIGWNSTGDALTNIDPTTLATVVGYATAYADTFTGDGVTTSWTLTRNPAVLYNLDVSINGSTQVPGVDYNLNGTLFTTTTPAPANSVILVKYKEGLPNFSGDSQDVRYLGYGLGAMPRTVQSRLRDKASVVDYGADPTGANDSTSAFTTALAASQHVYVPPGTYRCDSMIELNSYRTLELGGGANLVRKSAHSASTNPVIWVKGNGGSIIGAGQSSSNIRSENKSPNGVVLIGHWSMTESHGNVLYNTLRDFGITGCAEYGQTSGAPDIALHIQNPQFNGLAVYFQNISGLFLGYANYGLWLHAWANGNTINNLQFYKVGDNTVNGGAAIYDNGSLDNAISDVFVHFSPNAVGILMEQCNNTANGGAIHSTFATSYKGIVCEQGGASALGLKAMDGSVGSCYFEVRHNVSGGNQADADFGKRNTFIGLGSYGQGIYDQGMTRSQRVGTLTNLTTTVHKEFYGNLNGLTESNQYKVFDLAIGTNNSGAIVEISFAAWSAAGINWAGGGSLMVSVNRKQDGSTVVKTLRYNTDAGGNFCEPTTSSGITSFVYQVPNNGTGTSVFGIGFTIKVTAMSTTFNNSMVVYSDTNKVTTSGKTPLTAPISA